MYQIKEWYHIEFQNGSNPYICFNEKELNKFKKKYELIELKPYFYLAIEK